MGAERSCRRPGSALRLRPSDARAREREPLASRRRRQFRLLLLRPAHLRPRRWRRGESEKRFTRQHPRRNERQIGSGTLRDSRPRLRRVLFLRPFSPGHGRCPQWRSGALRTMFGGVRQQRPLLGTSSPLSSAKYFGAPPWRRPAGVFRGMPCQRKTGGVRRTRRAANPKEPA